MTGKRKLTFLAVLGVAALALSVGMVSAAGDTEVSVEPSDENVSANAVQTFEVVVENAPEDVAAFEFDVSLSNGNAAEITGASPTVDLENQDFNVNISDSGDSVTVDGVFLNESGDVFDSNSPAIVEIDVRGSTAGETTEVDTNLATSDDPVVGIANATGDKYTVTASNAATLTVEEAGSPTLPNAQGPAQDLNGDGQFEDVNGDGSFNIIDIALLFENRSNSAVTNNAVAFDFNGDGSFNIIDVATLFQNR
jgi:uncharacterized protein with beta-barrel porin domain